MAISKHVFGKRIPPSKARAGERVALRAPSTGHAEIRYASKLIPCSVLNISKTGALLRVETILGIPHRFELRVRSGRFAALVVRRGMGRIAVTFQ